MKVITSKFFTLCFMLTAALVGCNKAPTPGDPVDPVVPVVPVVPITDTLSITVTMPLQDTGVATRTGDSEAEVAIKSAYVIIYADNAADNDLPILTDTIEVENITQDPTNVNNRVLTFPKDGEVANGDDIHIMFNHSLASLDIAKSSLKEALKITTATDVASAGLVDITNGLPMYGTGPLSADDDATVIVKHSVAKVQLKLDYNGGDYVDGRYGIFTPANTTFKLYQLSNIGYADGSFPASTDSSPITEIANESEINQPSVSTEVVDEFTGASYIFAYPYSKQSIGTSPVVFVDESPKAERIAVIIKNIADDGDVYHRLDIYSQATKKYFDIKSTYHYTVILREVNSVGYRTATDALAGLPSDIKYDLIIEDETGAIVNNEYQLNVDSNGVDFKVSPLKYETVIVELAKVNLVDYIDAPVTDKQNFDVALEESFRVELASNGVWLDPRFPTTLGKDPESVNVSVSGTGVVLFRYIATLGYRKYKSDEICVNSNLSGSFSAAIRGDSLIFDVKSSSDGVDWSAESDSPLWAEPIKVDNKLKVAVKFNTASGVRAAKITVRNTNDDVIVITISQDGFPYFADRNIGASWTLATEEELCLPANSQPTNILDWQTENPRKFFTWEESVGQCEKWTYQDKKWRQPTKNDFDAVVASGRFQFSQAPNNAVKLEQNDGTAIYFPILGNSKYLDRTFTNHWGIDQGLRLFVEPTEVTTSNSGTIEHGQSIRCVLD